MGNRIEGYIQDKQKDLEFLKKLLMEKFTIGELDSDTLQRVTEEIYNIGHYIGHCRGEQYKRELIAGYEQAITELETALYNRY